MSEKIEGKSDLIDKRAFAAETRNISPDLLKEKPVPTQVAIDPNNFYANYKGELFTGKVGDFYEVGDVADPHRPSMDPFKWEALQKGIDPYEEGLKKYQQNYIDPLGLENALN